MTAVPTDADWTRQRTLLRVLLAVFAAFWIALAIAPSFRRDWLLENMLVILVLPWLVWRARALRLSTLAWCGLFAFGLLHELGAHYTYSEVPWREWLGMATQGRNPFDRFVHFAYGLLILPAVSELIGRQLRSRGFWAWMLPVAFIALHSMLYELIEWAAAVVFGGDLGQAYLGTQGDPWDAQEDMAMALLGSVLAQTALTLLRPRPGGKNRRPTVPADGSPGSDRPDPARG